MKKKEYLKPAMEVVETDVQSQILAGSVTGVATTGLDEDLELDGTGDSWGDAMSRRRRNRNVWDDEEVLEEEVEEDW